MAEPEENSGATAAADALQERFFSAPNRYRVGGAIPSESNDETMARLEPMLRRHRDDHTERPLLLPFQGSGPNDGTSWYACAKSDVMARALEAELVAFLGPSFVEIYPDERDLDDADRHALPLLAAAGLRAVRFRATEPKFDQMVLQQWQLYWELLERRPKAASYMPQTFDQLRATFDRALAARNEVGALAALSSLRERHCLSSENRLYLEIRLAAALDRWEWIARHRLLPTLVHLNLPPETYGDVMEALYEVHVRPFEQAPRLEDLLNQFSETLRQIAQPLFRTRRTSQRAAVIKSFVLHELTQESPQPGVCKDLASQLGLVTFGGLDASLRARVATLESIDDFSAARQALELEEFDRAYALLWPLTDTADVLRGLLRCAREAEEPLKAQAVMARLAAAPAEMREQVKRTAPRTLQKVQEVAAKNPVESPVGVAQVWQRPGETEDNYVERWRELARGSLGDALLREPAIGAVAAECLMHLVIERPDVFERVYPLWHELFIQRAEPCKGLLPVYSALLETLRARDAFGDTERELIRDTLMALVHAGANATQYRGAIEETLAVFQKERSPHAMNWALDICDSLAIAPVRDAAARLQFLAAIVQAGIDFRSRLSSLQKEHLRMLADEAGMPIPADALDSPALPSIESVAPPNDTSVAFYSLDTEATRRATELLRRIYPHVRVDSNSDHVCTPRLKSLAQSADVFVFAWKSSKHAAYDCVKVARGAAKTLVMATGAGTTSLLQAATSAFHSMKAASG